MANAGALVALVVLVGRWDMAGYYTRFLILAAVLAAALRSSIGLSSHASEQPAGRRLRRHWPTLISFILLASALGYVVAAMLAPAGARDVTFPLVGAVHGGSGWEHRTAQPSCRTS